MKDMQYKVYVTDVLMSLNSSIVQRYYDMISTRQVVVRDGDEIAEEVMAKGGLKKKDECI